MFFGEKIVFLRCECATVVWMQSLGYPGPHTGEWSFPTTWKFFLIRLIYIYEVEAICCIYQFREKYTGHRWCFFNAIFPKNQLAYLYRVLSIPVKLSFCSTPISILHSYRNSYMSCSCYYNCQCRSASRAFKKFAFGKDSFITDKQKLEILSQPEKVLRERVIFGYCDYVSWIAAISDPVLYSRSPEMDHMNNFGFVAVFLLLQCSLISASRWRGQH